MPYTYYLKSVLKEPLILLKFFVIFCVIAILGIHCSNFEVELRNVNEPWWVWVNANEGEIKTFQQVSWKVADNNDVIKSFGVNESEPKYDDLDYKSYKRGIFKAYMNELLSESNGTKAFVSKTILVLGTKKDRIDVHSTEGFRCKKCIFSSNLDDLANADAVVIGNGYCQTRPLPERRNRRQLFVWMNRRSPYDAILNGGSPMSFDRFNAVFNLTMSHRRESDIVYLPFSTYERMEELNSSSSKLADLRHLLRIKSKLIYWRPQVCGSTSVSRIGFDIVYQLKLSGLEMDFFGPCWQRKASHNYPAVFSKYKFYLSIGNEWHCRDYMTKDIWDNALSIGAVPVIWGPSKSTVERLLPKNSYLFLEDFVSAFEVTNYLEFLFADDDAFIEYLSWREKPWNVNYPSQALENQLLNGFCQLCSVVHNRDIKEHRMIPSLHQWWMKDESPYCVAPKHPRETNLEWLWWWRQLVLVRFSLYFPLVFSASAIDVYIFIRSLFIYLCVFLLIKVTRAHMLVYSILLRLNILQSLPINRIWFKIKFQTMKSRFLESLRSDFSIKLRNLSIKLRNLSCRN